MNFKVLFISLSILCVVISGCSTNSRDHTTSSSIRTEGKNISLDLITTKDIPKASNQEQLIEKGVKWKLSNGEKISPRSSDIISNLRFGNAGIVSVKVPKVTIPTYYFFITNKNVVWTIKGVMGAQLHDVKKDNGLPKEFSKLDQVEMNVKNIGHFIEFYNKETFITICYSNSVIPSLKGKQIKLNSGQSATLFKEDNFTGVYYPLGSSWVIIAGNIDVKSLISIADDSSLDRYFNLQ